MKRTLALAAVLAATVPTLAAESPKCKPVTGHFEAVVVPPFTGHCTAPTFCTAGRVWGGINGNYEFMMTSFIPSGFEAVFFFTGQSVVFLQSGDEVRGTDTGSIDPVRGGFASLISFTGGTGAMSGATGQIRLRGELGEASTSGDYVGELCTP